MESYDYYAIVLAFIIGVIYVLRKLPKERQKNFNIYTLSEMVTNEDDINEVEMEEKEVVKDDSSTKMVENEKSKLSKVESFFLYGIMLTITGVVIIVFVVKDTEIILITSLIAISFWLLAGVVYISFKDAKVNTPVYGKLIKHFKSPLLTPLKFVQIKINPRLKYFTLLFLGFVTVILCLTNPTMEDFKTEANFRIPVSDYEQKLIKKGRETRNYSRIQYWGIFSKYAVRVEDGYDHYINQTYIGVFNTFYYVTE